MPVLRTRSEHAGGCCVLLSPEHGWPSPGTRQNETSDTPVKCPPPSWVPTLGPGEVSPLACAPPAPFSLGGTHGGMGVACSILLPWAHGGAHQHRDHQLLSMLQGIMREQRCRKTRRGNPLQPETAAQHSAAPCSLRGHVTGPTSSCTGACWAGRRQNKSQPQPHALLAAE